MTATAAKSQGAALSDTHNRGAVESHAHPELSRQQRRTASALGGLALLVGIAALFLAENDAGTVAILAIAATFLLVALMGRFPTKAKWGDKEIFFGKELAEGLREIVREDPDSSVSAAVTEAVSRAQRVAGTDLGRDIIIDHNQAMQYERAVGEYLERALPEGARIEAEQSPGGFRFDYLIEHGDRSIGIEVKWRAGDMLDRTVIEAIAIGKAYVQHLLLVTNVPLTQRARDLLQQMGDISVVTYRPNGDPSELQRALHNLLN